MIFRSQTSGSSLLAEGGFLLGVFVSDKVPSFSAIPPLPRLMTDAARCGDQTDRALAITSGDGFWTRRFLRPFSFLSDSRRYIVVARQVPLLVTSLFSPPSLAWLWSSPSTLRLATFLAPKAFPLLVGRDTKRQACLIALPNSRGNRPLPVCFFSIFGLQAFFRSPWNAFKRIWPQAVTIPRLSFLYLLFPPPPFFVRLFSALSQPFMDYADPFFPLPFLRSPSSFVFFFLFLPVLSL